MGPSPGTLHGYRHPPDGCFHGGCAAVTPQQVIPSEAKPEGWREGEASGRDSAAEVSRQGRDELRGQDPGGEHVN
jgi:hypothetical protein